MYDDARIQRGGTPRPRELCGRGGFLPGGFRARGLLPGVVATEGFRKVFEHFRELTSHHGEIDIELLVFVDLVAISRILGHLEKLDSLDLQLLGENEGDPTIPRHAKARRVFAAGQMCLDLFSIQYVTDVSDGGLVRICCLQLEILVDAKCARRVAVSEPRGHGRMRCTLRLYELYGKGTERIAQSFDELFGFASAAGVDDKPAVDRIYPGARHPTPRERPRAQLLRNPHL